MSLLKRWMRSILPNPLEVILTKARRKGHHRFLLAWNRGLGDIPLGLYAIKHRIISCLPDAKITFLTRPDLAEGFEMLGGCDVICCPSWVRGQTVDVKATLEEKGMSISAWDVVIASPDPSYWCQWQLGKLSPQLVWKSDWDMLAESFSLDFTERYLGVHMQTQTSYGYEKNWPLDFFAALFQRVTQQRRQKIILFGAKADALNLEGVIDLRGKTTVKQMLGIIKRCCSHLLAPDSGVLSMTYYLHAPFALKIVSLWADPFQGILKQATASANPKLTHIPLIARKGDLTTVSPQEVYSCLFEQGDTDDV